MADPQATDLITAFANAHAGARLDDVGSFQQLTHPLLQLADRLRDGYRRAVAEPITAIIAKLQKGRALTDEDKASIEAFIVGDAEAYTRLENDFQGWIAELARLVAVLSDMKPRLEGAFLLDALGEVEDARRVLGDICNYLAEKDRIAKFKRTMAQGIDKERAEVLVELLREQLEAAGS